MSGLRKISIDWFNDIQARKSLETIAPISNSISASSSSRNETDENGSKQKQPMRQSSFWHVRDLPLLLLLIYFSRLAVLEQTVRRLPSEKNSVTKIFLVRKRITTRRKTVRCSSYVSFKISAY